MTARSMNDDRRPVAMAWWRRKEPAIPPEVRDELEQSFEWWDREYRRLFGEAFEEVPFDPAQHRDCDTYEVLTFTGTAVLTGCADCPTAYRPRLDKPAVG